MKPLTPKQVNHNLLLDLNHSDCHIHCQTGISPNTISNIHKKYCPNLQKSTGGCSKILSSVNLCHGAWLLTFGQVDTAPQLAHCLQEIKGRSISIQTVHCGFKSIGIKCHRQATVSHRFQIGFRILTPVRLVLLRTYHLKWPSQVITWRVRWFESHARLRDIY